MRRPAVLVLAILLLPMFGAARAHVARADMSVGTAANAPVSVTPDASVGAATDTPVSITPDPSASATPDGSVSTVIDTPISATPDVSATATPDTSVSATSNPPVSAATDVVVQLGTGASISSVEARTHAHVLEVLPDGFYRLSVPEGVSPTAELRTLDTTQGVADAQPDYTVTVGTGEHFRDYFVENGSDIAPTEDPYLSSYQDQWASGAIGLSDALMTARGAGVEVAVVDTAVSETHPILAAGALQPGISTIGTTVGTYNDAGAPHGTFIAGLIHLVAPDATILPVQALADDGTGRVFDVAQGVRAAVDAGAQVINLSLGVSGDSLVLDDAINYAQDHGVLVVASAGNDGSNESHYPSDYPGVISVAAVGSDQARADFSNYGPNVTLSAPGEDTVSTIPDGGYATWGGTSMAAAMVSGAAALTFASHVGASAGDVRLIMIASATDLSAGNPDLEQGQLGAGLVNVIGAVDYQLGT